MLTADSFPQIRHLYRRQRRFESLVPHLQSGAINRLLQRLAGQHSERMRNSSLLRRLPNPPSHFVHNHVVMRRVAAQQAANTDDRVVFLRLGKRTGGQGNFKRSGDTDQHDVFFLRARAQQPVVGALEKSLRDERVEARDDKGKAPTRGAKTAVDGGDRRLGNTLDFYFFFRAFSPCLCISVVNSRRIPGASPCPLPCKPLTSAI